MRRLDKLVMTDILLIIGTLILIGSVAAYLLPPERLWAHLEVHSAVEAMGALSALMLAPLILFLRKQGAQKSSHIWVACALIGMGLLDGLHSFVPPGESFVWLHSMATLVGGLLFAMVWLPTRISMSSFASSLPKIVFVAASIFGLISIASPDSMPLMLRQGIFTPAARTINLLGGLLFLSASLWFFMRYLAHKAFDEILFANHCFLFGIAGVIFEFSELWDAEWWLWHLIRLMAYLILFFYIFNNYKQTDTELQELNESLEERIKESMAANVLLEQEITERMRAEKEKAIVIVELKEALSKIKTLKGLVPICAWCKRIRNDKGYWDQVEAYIEAHSDAKFTHGICPECMKEHYPKILEKHPELLQKPSTGPTGKDEKER